MKKFTKVMALVLALSMVATLLLAGCAKKPVTNDGEVTLKWVYNGSVQEDSQKVWAAFNEKLKEYLPNTTVEFEPIEGASYAEKWKLKMASGEPVDIAWTGYTATYVDEIANGAFMDITDLLDEYGKDVKAELPDWVWEIASVDGRIYSIPNYQMMNQLRLGFSTPYEFKEMGILTDEIEKNIIDTFYSHEFVCEEDYAALEEYIKACKDAGYIIRGVDPVTTAHLGEWKGYEYLLSETNPYSIKKTDPNLEVLNVYAEDTMKITFKTMSDWYKKGYIRKDIASAAEASTIAGLEGKGIFGFHGYYDIYNPNYDVKPEGQRVWWIPCDDHFFVSCSQSKTSSAIPTTSKNPERAMQLLNLMNSKKGAELLNLLSYGIEGEHYTMVEGRENVIDTSIAKIGKTGSTKKYGASNWVLGNTFNAYEESSNPPGWNDYFYTEVNGKAVISPVMGFKVDANPVKTEIASVNSTIGEFLKPLKQGVLPDWQEKYDEMLAKMETAGSQRIIDEIQRQIDEWKVKNKK